MKRWPGWLTVWLACSVGAAGATTDVCRIRIEGPIGPATASYVARALDTAAERGAVCLLIQLDTPGGLLDSTKTIVQKFLATSMPTVVYVAPAGAHAGSAGCFITLAADVAAMSPTTAIGAAHPVDISGRGELDDTMKQKLENFYGSYIETIANKRGRNADWARSSVRDSASISAEEALKLGVIDLIAADQTELLAKLDGREINGRPLRTAGATVIELPMTTRERVFQMVAHPQLMLVLMLVVMYGIIGELTNPGAILPGVVGAIALVLVLYLSAVLPLNAAGLALIGLAMALFIIDVFAPTHGVLTAGGVVAFFLGSFMLFDRTEPFLRLSLAWLIPATAVTTLFFMFVVGAGLRAQWRPVAAGPVTMVGRVVPALTRIDARGGKVFVEGEYWNAVSHSPIEAGQPVEIAGVEGLTLQVKAKPS